jgi:hypothetical protein
MPRAHKRHDLAAPFGANPVRSCSKCPGDLAKSPRAGALFLRRKVCDANGGLTDRTFSAVEEDEGGPLGVGVQKPASNHAMLL